jgi:hypothetical protein
VAQLTLRKRTVTGVVSDEGNANTRRKAIEGNNRTNLTLMVTPLKHSKPLLLAI